MQIFKITEAAGAHLASILAEVETSEDENVVIRMFKSKDGLDLTFGHVDSEDTTFAHQGVTVLAINEELSQSLANMTLDVETTVDGTTLQLR